MTFKSLPQLESTQLWLCGPNRQLQSESIGPECESESSESESESESASSTKVRVSPDLSPYPAWTHESNNRKVLYFNPTFNHFC